jgi:hypothetical protein
MPESASAKNALLLLDRLLRDQGRTAVAGLARVAWP